MNDNELGWLFFLWCYKYLVAAAVVGLIVGLDILLEIFLDR